jgi:hypothetical protein
MSAQTINTPSPGQPSLRKVLGVSDGVAVLIGIMIGAGIYSTPQIIAGYLSSFQTIIAFWILVGIFQILNTLALFKLKKNKIGGEDVYRVPLFPILPIIFLVGIIVLLVFRAVAEWENSLVDLAFIASGIPFSFIWCREAARGGL